MIIERKRYDEEYIPSKDTIKFFAWFNTFFKEENRSAEAHLQLIDHLFSKNRHKVIECTRGLGKSTLMRYSILYWCFLGKKPNFGDIDYILIIQDSVSMAEATFETIIGLIENSELSNYLEIKKKRLGDDPTIHIWNKDKQKMIYLKGKGSGQSLRGINIHGKRPNIVILDDIESEEKHATPETRTKLKNWFFNVVVPAINPNKFEFIFIGTPIHEDALLMNLIESETWKAIQLPVAEEYPPPKGKDVVSCWSDRFTKEYIDEIYSMYKSVGKENSFYQEYMLELHASEESMFKKEYFTYFEPKDIRNNVLNIFISCDIAYKENETSDYTALVVVGVNSENHWFILEIDYGRWKPQTTIDRLFKLARKWNPLKVGIESIFYEEFERQLQNKMMKENSWFSIEELKHRGKAKTIRIQALQPMYKMKMVHHMKDAWWLDELEHELTMFTEKGALSKHDDLIDALSYINQIAIAPIGGCSQYSTNYLGYDTDLKVSTLF